MRRPAKTTQLQIRVTPAEKRQIERDARAAGLPVSEWVLLRLIRPARASFARLMQRLAAAREPASYVLADLHDLLVTLSADQLESSLTDPPPAALGPVLANQVAAMVESACSRKAVLPPAWTADIGPLEQPWFASDAPELRLHLLTASPPPFRRRNLFVNATLGARV